MRSINTLAEKVSRSYATEENARRAFTKLMGDYEVSGGYAVIQRTDGRWVNIVINPDMDMVLFFAHNGVGCFA